MRILFIISFNLLVLSCSKQKCDCTDIKTEDGVVTETIEYEMEIGRDAICRSRGSSDTINGVFTTNVFNCHPQD